MECISKKTWQENHEQFLHHESYWEHGENRIKVNIRCDTSHDWQSYAHCYVWSKQLQKWELIANIPFTEINAKTYNTLVVRDLLDLALRIIE